MADEVFSLYTTSQLLGVINILPVESSYWLDNYYQRQITFTTEEIMFDKVTKIRRLAPFVSPVVQGRVMRTRGYETRTFRPAYTKPKHIVDPNQQFIRLAGEGITGTLSPLQRWQAAYVANQQEEVDTIRRLWNWMAAQATIYGQVTVAGDDYPTQVVNFGRDPSLTLALAGTAQWGEADADPLANLAAMRTQSFLKSGSAITRVTMGLDAFDRLYDDEKVQALLKGQEIGNVARTSDSTLSALGSTDTPFELRGILQGANGQGRLEVYTYNEQYEDRDGVTQPYMSSYDVVGTGPGLGGVQCFGAIKDKRAGLQALPLFPKSWDQEDPSLTYQMTQSAPLMVPSNPDNSFRIVSYTPPA